MIFFLPFCKNTGFEWFCWIVQTLGLCHLKYKSRSQTTPVGCRGLWSATQVNASLRLQREVLEGPVGSSWGAYLLPGHTHHGRSETTEPRKAGKASAHGGEGVVVVVPLDLDIFRHYFFECCIHNVGAFSVICAQGSLWRLVFCLLVKVFRNLGVHLGQNLLRNSSLARMEAWGRKGLHTARQEKSMYSCQSFIFGSLPFFTRDRLTSRGSVSVRSVWTTILRTCLTFWMWVFVLNCREAVCLSQLIQIFAFLSFGFLYLLNIVVL